MIRDRRTTLGEPRIPLSRRRTFARSPAQAMSTRLRERTSALPTSATRRQVLRAIAERTRSNAVRHLAQHSRLALLLLIVIPRAVAHAASTSSFLAVIRRRPR